MTETGACKRCKGAGHIEEDGCIYNCPDCEGTGEDFDDDTGEDTNVEDSDAR